MTIESRPIDAKALSYINREKWEPCLNCKDMGRAGKAVEGVMICVVAIVNLDINVMIRKKYRQRL